MNIKILALAAFAVAGHASAAEKKMTHKDTEVWEPKRAVVTPSDVPSDAIVLFDGKDASQWQHDDGSAVKWSVSDGAMTVVRDTKGIHSKEKFCDIQLHIEWRTPKKNKSLKPQQMGNSGIYFQRRYELQVLDSFQNEIYINGQAGAIYKQSPPLVNASKPPLQWQTYDVIYHAPQFDDAGKLTKKANITAFHNGILIQDHFEILGPTLHTGHPSYKEAHGCEGIALQNHNDWVSYRNIWVRKL